MMKINVDASISKNLKVASAVVVTCNTTGSFLGASTMVLEGVLEPETLEVLACREGFALSSDLGLQRLEWQVTTSMQLGASKKGAWDHVKT
jgi:hypothetical protein